MKTHTIPQKPAILHWEDIPALAIDSRHWTPPVDIAAQAQICYDEKALYVRLSAQESPIRAEESGPLGMPCRDSCLEFFFCPIPEDDRYFNIEFNPNGCLYLGMGSGPQDLVRLVPEEADLLQAEPKRTEGGWEITYCVPTHLITRFFPDYAPVSGGTLRANFFKCGDLTRQEHYFAWNPMTSETPNFHSPRDFGCLIFA